MTDRPIGECQAHVVKELADTLSKHPILAALQQRPMTPDDVMPVLGALTTMVGTLIQLIDTLAVAIDSQGKSDTHDPS